MLSLLRRLVRKQTAKNVDAVLLARGGTSALLTATAPGTRDHALVTAEEAGLVVRTERLDRIDLVRFGPIFDFRLTPQGEIARRRVISGDPNKR